MGHKLTAEDHFACNQCDETFDDTETLMSHKQTVSVQALPIPCQPCSITFCEESVESRQSLYPPSSTFAKLDHSFLRDASFVYIILPQSLCFLFISPLPPTALVSCFIYECLFNRFFSYRSNI